MLRGYVLVLKICIQKMFLFLSLLLLLYGSFTVRRNKNSLHLQCNISKLFISPCWQIKVKTGVLKWQCVLNNHVCGPWSSAQHQFKLYYFNFVIIEWAYTSITQVCNVPATAKIIISVIMFLLLSGQIC